MSYQEHLRSLNQDDGLSAEIQSFSHYANDYQMRSWNYDDDRVLELRYEELIKNEPDHFEKLFRHYGFGDSAIERLKATCEVESLESGIPF